MVLITLANEDEMKMVWGEDLCQAAIQNLARAFVKTDGDSSKVIVIYTRVVILLEEAEFDTAQERCRILADRCRSEYQAELLCYIGEPVFCEQLADTYSSLLTYSKDGISYTDIKGNALWNQTYEMQNPMVRVAGTRVAVADYNGHIIHNIDQAGNSVEIDTNLPIREFAISENGMVAAVLEDTNITWIYLYNSQGDKVAYVKTTMQKSGYPAALALSPDGKLMAVSYIAVENGSTKSSVAFYNFSSVGQNFVDNFASGADYVDAVIPYITFLSNDTAFAVADNRLVIYSGDQRPKSSADVFLDGEIQSVFYSGSYIGLVFLDTTGQGKYRLDVYNTSGTVVTSQYFDIEYKDIILYKDSIIIYNETQCMIANLHGLVRFHGEFENPLLLFSPVSAKKYLAVSKDSIDIIEMK